MDRMGRDTMKGEMKNFKRLVEWDISVLASTSSSHRAGLMDIFTQRSETGQLKQATYSCGCSRRYLLDPGMGKGDEEKVDGESNEI